MYIFSAVAVLGIFRQNRKLSLHRFMYRIMMSSTRLRLRICLLTLKRFSRVFHVSLESQFWIEFFCIFDKENSDPVRNFRFSFLFFGSNF